MDSIFKILHYNKNVPWFAQEGADMKTCGYFPDRQGLTLSWDISLKQIQWLICVLHSQARRNANQHVYSALKFEMSGLIVVDRPVVQTKPEGRLIIAHVSMVICQQMLATWAFNIKIGVSEGLVWLNRAADDTWEEELVLSFVISPVLAMLRLSVDLGLLTSFSHVSVYNTRGCDVPSE